MQRINKTVYSDDKGHELLSLKNGKATLLWTYHDFDADELDALGIACQAAAEELRSLELAEK